MVKAALTDHLKHLPPAVMDAEEGRQLLKAMFGQGMTDKKVEEVLADLAKQTKASKKKGSK